MKHSHHPHSISHGALGCPSEDEQLQQDVCAALIALPELDAREIEVGLLGSGCVRLGGSVRSERERQLAVSVAKRHPRARSVKCELKVL